MIAVLIEPHSPVGRHGCGSALWDAGAQRGTGQKHSLTCCPRVSLESLSSLLPCLWSLSLGALAYQHSSLRTSALWIPNSVFQVCILLVWFLLHLFSSVGFKIVIIKQMKWTCPIQALSSPVNPPSLGPVTRGDFGISVVVIVIFFEYHIIYILLKFERLEWKYNLQL